MAIVASTFAYSCGAVVSRDLLRRHSPYVIAGWSQLYGGATLFGVCALQGADGFATAPALAEPAVLASWAFLVVFSSGLAFSAYLYLTHRWTPHRAGLHAFVSPVIAVFAGVALLGERVAGTQLLGMALMLAGTLVSLAAPLRDEAG